MTTIERRTFLGEVEFRADGDLLRAIGYAAKFNVRSQDLGGFLEEVAPGAFAKTVREADVRGLFNHDPNQVLGRNRAGTLRLAEDKVGLRYEIDLPDTSAGRDIATLLERGDISGSSFGFRTIADAWDKTEDGFPIRTLKEVALRDVGPVTFPAYTDATSSLRHLAEVRSLDLDALVAAAKEQRLSDLLDAEPAEAADAEVIEEESRDIPTPILYRHLAI